MATRFAVPLAHAGCDHTGSVVWEQRGGGNPPGEGSPVLVSLPRGFASLNAEDGSIEIVCARCRQTVASAARGAAPGPARGIGASADQGAGTMVANRGDTAEEKSVAADGATTTMPSMHGGPSGGATPSAAAPTNTAAGPMQTASVDTAAGAEVPADVEALFAQTGDVAPIRADKIPPHLLDRLRHLADRMRQRRE